MDKNMYEFLVMNQYNLPRRLHSSAYRFPHVAFYQALELYEISVREVLTLYRAKNLYDKPLGFGRGIVLAKELWLEKMAQAEKIQRNRKEGEKNLYVGD